VAAYGLAVELVQGALPARSFELADAAANAVGSGVAALAWRVGIGIDPR
jgi:VanZ family protein